MSTADVAGVTEPATMRRRGLGSLLPLVIAAFMALDVLARFLPLDPLCFQAWECMTRYQEPGAAFQANRQFRSDRTHGNLSNMGNLPGLRQYRPQVFTTDRYGYRNVETPGRPDVIVVGDSFAAGDGLSDRETLSVELSSLTGRRVYNGGGPYAYLATVRSLKSKFQLQRASVIVVWTENVPISFFTDAESRVRNPDWKRRLLRAAFGERGERVSGLVSGWWSTSPVRILAEKAYLSISDDRVLPNIYARRVTRRQLRTGTTMLFYPPDVDEFHRVRDVSSAHDYLVWLAAELRKEGMIPLIALAPSKYSVYYPLLEGATPGPGDAVHPLARLEASLRASGISALDLTASFREQARHDAARGEYIYWLDDTHWNRAGVGVAARVMQRLWFDRPEDHARHSQREVNAS